MINLLTNSTLRAALVTSVTFALLIVAADTNAEPRYGKTPPHFRKGIKTVQYPSAIPSVEVPTPAFEASTVMPPASEVVVPAIEGVVPSYEVPVTETPMANQYDYPLAEGEVLVEPAPYEQYTPGQQFTQQPIASGDQPAPIYSTGSWHMNGQWYGQADVVWLKRDTPTEVFVLRDISLGRTLRLDNMLELDYAPGARLTLGRFLGRDAANRDYGIDFTYLGGFGWDSGASIVSRDGGSVPANTSSGLDTLFNSNGDRDDLTEAFFSNDRQDVRFESQLNSFELNYRIRTRPGRDQLAMQPDGRWVRHGVGSQMRTLLGGIRFVSLSEGFGVTATTAGSESTAFTSSIADPTNPTTVPSDEISDLIRGQYTVNTDNDMIGFQLGGELVEKSDEWSWGLRGKVGGLLNFAGRQSLITSVLRETRVETEMVPAVDANGDPVFVDAFGNIVTDLPDTAEDETMAEGVVRGEDTVVTTFLDPVTEQQGDGRDAESIAFLAEVGLFGSYQIRPNFHFKAGYDLILLSGVGVAPKNASLVNGFNTFNTSSTAFYHGGSFGFETTW